MATLIAPNENTPLVRFGESWGKRKWHIARETENGKWAVGLCGTVCIDPEWSTLGEIKAKDLCHECWPYAKE